MEHALTYKLWKFGMLGFFAVCLMAGNSPAQETPGTGARAQRRDPFRPLIVEREGEDLPARLPPGKAGLVIGQLTLQGIVRGLEGVWIAVVDNNTNRAYFLYEGDELYNGVVTRITADSITLEERSTDSIGRVRTRDVVKRLGAS